MKVRVMGSTERTDDVVRVSHLQVDMWVIVRRTCANADELLLGDIDLPDPDIVFVFDDCRTRSNPSIHYSGLVFRASRKFDRLE